MISLLLMFSPLSGCLATLLLPQHLSKQVCLSSTVLTYLISMVIWLHFNPLELNMQFQVTLTDWNVGQLSFGIDQLSLWYIILCNVTMPAVILAS